MKNIFCDGRLGQDPVTRVGKNGQPFVTFSIACDSQGKDVEWLDVISFDDYIVNNKAKSLKKGSHVMIVGDPSVKLITKNGVPTAKMNIIARQLEFISSHKKGDTEPVEQQKVSVYSEKSNSTYTNLGQGVSTGMPEKEDYPF